MQQKTVVFDHPIDALSVQFPTKGSTAFVRTGDTWTLLSVEDEHDPTLYESNLVMFSRPTSVVRLQGNIDQLLLHPIAVSNAPASYEVASINPVGHPRILSRDQWGADESFLFQSHNTVTSSEPETSTTTSTTPSQREVDCQNAQRNYPADFTTTKTVMYDSSGNRLRWPRRYSPEVKVLAVHHTAQKIAGDTRTPIERIRALYAFHANNRGWGDIGYNYLIDEEGTIYEGRSGGDNVVGGHVYCGNVGTLGVALIGNFNEEEPSQAQVHALQWLLDDLAEIHDIDLHKNVTFHGKSIPPIVRHKDLIATECPGYYMSAAIGQVRSNVLAGAFDNDVTFPVIAQAKPRVDNTVTRLAARIEEAGAAALSRNYYRAKRLVRTAGRLNTTDARLQMMEDQIANTTNVQRQRAAQEARKKRIAAQSAPATQVPIVTSSSRTSTPDESIRIRLSYTGNTAEISAESSAMVNGTSVQTIRFGKEGNSCVGISGNRTLGQGIVRIDAGNGILRIDSWNTAWNRFVGTVECQVIDGQLVLINELPLEDYMAGISEQPDTEYFEKQKSFAVAARSYAAYYMQDAYTKFAGMPYDGSDTGVSFQKYSGVGFAEKNPQWAQAVRATEHVVITKDNQIVKAAYFSSDDGRTRTPAENGWNNFPFAEIFSSKQDPWCEGMALRGHGVGMSGCGAKAQAALGETAEAILQYYYPQTSLRSLLTLER